MENVVLAIHLIVALLLVGVVLLQRSEGGGLGMGSAGGTMTGRGVATALQKVTWALAVTFIATSITLTILAAKGSSTASVIDQFGGTAPAAPVEAPSTDSPLGTDLLPPASTDAPAAPPAAEAPAAPPAAPAPAGN
jgi:preprotein translocase subunit SecG